MTIYRIERSDLISFDNDHGYGPYQSGSFGVSKHIDKMFYEHSNPITHPVSSRDGLNRFFPVACPSFKALKSWFNGYTGHLSLLGYKCYAIKIPRRAVNISKSYKQCCYAPNAVLSRQRISFVTGKPL